MAPRGGRGWQRTLEMSQRRRRKKEEEEEEEIKPNNPHLTSWEKQYFFLVDRQSFVVLDVGKLRAWTGFFDAGKLAGRASQKRRT